MFQKTRSLINSIKKTGLSRSFFILALVRVTRNKFLSSRPGVFTIAVRKILFKRMIDTRMTRIGRINTDLFSPRPGVFTSRYSIRPSRYNKIPLMNNDIVPGIYITALAQVGATCF